MTGGGSRLRPAAFPPPAAIYVAPHSPEAYRRQGSGSARSPRSPQITTSQPSSRRSSASSLGPARSTRSFRELAAAAERQHGSGGRGRDGFGGGDEEAEQGRSGAEGRVKAAARALVRMFSAAGREGPSQPEPRRIISIEAGMVARLSDVFQQQRGSGRGLMYTR